MVPVIDMKKLRASVESRTPEERKASHERSTKLLAEAMASIERHKKYCEEQGIPYVPCVA